MKISVVIPTRGDHNMHNIIDCFNAQTYRDFEVIFVVDKHFSGPDEAYKNRENIKFITTFNSNLHPHNNASYLRNFGIEAAEGEFIQLMDDDEWFPENYLEHSLELRFKYREEVGKDFVLTPTLMYRKTGHIQNQGFASFNFCLSRPIPQVLGKKERDYIQMYSGNALFAPARIFQKIKFDEKIDFVYEDLDFSYRIYKAQYPIIVLRDFKIYHMERDKTILENARVGNPLQAYKKAKHRIVFVKKYANLIQRIQFYLLGFRGQPLRLIAKVVRYAPANQKRKIIHAIIKGTRDGLK